MSNHANARESQLVPATIANLELILLYCALDSITYSCRAAISKPTRAE
jgi:hypothetical protein